MTPGPLVRAQMKLGLEKPSGPGGLAQEQLSINVGSFFPLYRRGLQEFLKDTLGPIQRSTCEFVKYQ